METTVVEPPDIKYARSGDVAIAYQVVSDGRDELVFVPFFGNIRWAWEQPLFARFFERLASFFAPDPSRQAWHGALRQAAGAHPGDADGRHSRRSRRRGVRARGVARRRPGGQLCTLFAATCSERPRCPCRAASGRTPPRHRDGREAQVVGVPAQEARVAGKRRIYGVGEFFRELTRSPALASLVT